MLSVHIQKQFRGVGPPFRLRICEDFPPGFTVLFGSSGAGKSTLLDCIAGLLQPDSGRIALGEELFFDAGKGISRPPEKRRLGYVLQSLALFPHLSVEANVAYGLARVPREERRRRVRRTLEAFHILPFASRKPETLSGGEKQRVAFARSVITEPRVLLLDEPLTGLDGGLRHAILQDLRNWNAEQRIPILYVTHHREEVDALGDRVVGIANGQVTGRGSAQDVLDSPRAISMAQAAGFENLLMVRVLERRPADGVMSVGLDGKGTELEIPLGTAQVGETIPIALRAGDILLATQLPYGLSARNVLPGAVESMEARGTLVRLRVHAGVPFTVHLTPRALRSLELTRGSVVWLIVKTHSCHIVAPE